MLKFETNVKDHSIVTRNNAVPCYQTSKEIAWSLKLEKLKNIEKTWTKCVKKIAKICDIQKLKPIPWELKIF